MTDKEQFLSLLKGINRPGIEALAEYVEHSNFFHINCSGHHFTGEGGVVKHSLEVRENMLAANTDGFSEETISLLALCHDIGKCGRARYQYYNRGAHDMRSLLVLEACGVPLTPMEREGILTQTGKYYHNNLFQLLKHADGQSADSWQKAHPAEVAAKRAERAAKSHGEHHHHHHSEHHA